MVQYVTHTGRYTVLLQKKIEELFTLSPELPLLADLVFWLYFIVSQVAMLFLFIKIPKSVTQSSPLTKIKLTLLQLF